MTSITKTQRWLDLIAFLVGRRMPVAVDEIMEKVPAYAMDWVDGDDTARASVRRKFERDKDELRELGIPIETVQYRINYGIEEVDGYVLRSADFYLPYLEIVSGDAATSSASGDPSSPTSSPGRSGHRPSRASTRIPRFELRDDEARAAIEGLRALAHLPSSPLAREARSALRKLAFDLGSGPDAGADAVQMQMPMPMPVPMPVPMGSRLRLHLGVCVRVQARSRSGSSIHPAPGTCGTASGRSPTRCSGARSSPSGTTASAGTGRATGGCGPTGFSSSTPTGT